MSVGLITAGVCALRESALQFLGEWLQLGGGAAAGVKQRQRDANAAMGTLETICADVRNRTTVLEGSCRELVEDLETLALRLDR